MATDDAAHSTRCVLAFGEFILPAVRVQISRYTDDSNPGWVECRMTDAWGTEWLFEEKVSSVSVEDLDQRSDYPQPGIIACEIVKRWRDEDDREIATIDTEKPWGLESSDGTTRFDVPADQLVDY